MTEDDKKSLKKRFRELATEQHHRDGELEIDDYADVSLSMEDGKVQGAYVQAWVWVDAPESA